MSPWQWAVFAVALWVAANVALVVVLLATAPDIDRMSDREFWGRVDDDGKFGP